MRSWDDLPDDSPAAPPTNQPSHTVYGGAQLFRANLAGKLSKTAQTWLERYGDPEASWYPAVLRRLRSGAVEDLRIDFEDGYGPRADEEEDEHARQASSEVLAGAREGTLPPRLGLRIKPLTRQWAARSLRTLEIFARGCEGLSRPLRLTLPKTSRTSQVELLSAQARELGGRHSLNFEIELMVESPESLPFLKEWCDFPISAVHFGPYDFLAACRANGGGLHHPLNRAAKIAMVFALAGTQVECADGPTAQLPIPPHRGGELTAAQQAENRTAVQAAWQLHRDDVRLSRELGLRQSWILHPGQLVSLHAQIFSESAGGWRPLADRLRRFLELSGQAMRTGDQFDDRATARLLKLQLDQALRDGAVELGDLERSLGQAWESLNF